MTGLFKSGSIRKQKNYESFLPSFINQNFKWQSSKVDLLLSEANRYLGELNAISKRLPDIDFYVHMHIMKEATTSNQIEGTRTSINEAILPEEEVALEVIDDWHEIQNYSKALKYSIEKLAQLPLSLRLLKQTHKVLLTGVRGEHKEPGEIRRSQNWIGGSNIESAFFIPPHHNDLADLLSDFEKFIHNDELDLPHLIKAAILHYQFETIHPFLDGNGRLGRLLIILYLIDKGILEKPVLFISNYFYKYRSSYFDSLTLVRTQSDMDHWLKFFLVGVRDTAQESIKILDAIFSLRKISLEKIPKSSKAKNMKLILDLFFEYPILNGKQIMEKSELSAPTVNSVLKDLIKLHIIEETTRQKRNKIYQFSEYLKLFNA